MGRRPTIRGESPWGPIQHIDAVDGSDGRLLFVTTAGHGGYWMDDELLAIFRRKFPEFQGYAGLPWLEEDCDWAMAHIAFDFFAPEFVEMAKRHIRSMPDYLKIGNAYLDRLEGKVPAGV